MAKKQELNWMNNYKLLLVYYQKNGHIDVPRNYVVDGVKLGVWLNNQRYIPREKMLEERVRLLDDLGMKWNLKKSKIG